MDFEGIFGMMSICIRMGDYDINGVVGDGLGILHHFGREGT